MINVIDGRDLQPPEPLELTLQALDDLAPDCELLLIVNCQPLPLYRWLQRNGFSWRERAAADGSFEILISHASRAASE